MTDLVARLMKRCQIGVGGRNALADAHDIMAECYGTLGRQQIEIERLRAENDALKRDLQHARDGLTKGRTRMREDNERLRAALALIEAKAHDGLGHFSSGLVRTSLEEVASLAKAAGSGK